LYVAVVRVVGSIGSLKVTSEVPARETPVAPFKGITAVTRGGVISRVVTVASGDSGDCSDRTPEVQFAETVYLYVTCCARPVSVKLVVVDSPTFVPFLKTL
jgi:hypothetical protein